MSALSSAEHATTPKPTPPPATPDPNLLTEYAAAQNSAQHHDILILHVTSVVWSGTLVMMGFVIANMERPALKIPLTLLCVLGGLLLAAVSVAMFQCMQLKHAKYDRCKQIEAEFNFVQHRRIPRLIGSRRYGYAFITGVMVIIWVVIVGLIWSH